MPRKCILIAGSAYEDCDHTKLARATEFVRAATEKIIETGNSVAVLATREPVRVENTRSVPLSFDWEVLRTIDCHLEQRDNMASYNMAHVFMGSDSMDKRFTPENATLIQRLQAKGAIDIRHIEESLYSGGEYRDRQAELCDAMIAIGGGKGTYQVADKMLSFGKPVMPMDSAQCVLGDCALAQLHTGQRSEYRRYPPNRYAHSVVQHVRRSHHSSANPMGACPVLVRSNLGMPSSYTSATATTPAHLHTIASHLGSGHLGNVGHVRKTLSVVFEYASTSGTDVRCNRNVSDRCCQFIGYPDRRSAPECCGGHPTPR